uniref:C2H2-type domain-containing protein n=1 Tax=Cacopsylla melanoneura TaxID=428564 RepID=A0A8D8SUP9_9HEMI
MSFDGVVYYFSEVACRHCYQRLSPSLEFVYQHSKTCPSMVQPDDKGLVICCLCEYRTVHQGNMKVHIRKHIGDKPYKCSYCSYDSPQLVCVKRHIILRHSTSNDTSFRGNKTKRAKSTRQIRFTK